jgi:hypothetical protein
MNFDVIISSNFVFLLMELLYINMYQRLRDFKVPAAILDDIFGNKEELNKLSTAWKALKSDGFSDDDAAEEISKIFFKELYISDD